MKFRGWATAAAVAPREQADPPGSNADGHMPTRFAPTQFFVNDLETTPTHAWPTKPCLRGFRGRPEVGRGRSIMWGRQVYRWSDLDFEATPRRASASTADFVRRHADVVFDVVVA